MRKLLLTLAVLCGTVSGWAESVKYGAPSLPGTLTTTEYTGQNYNQYRFTSPKLTAPEGFTTLRLTFLANSNNEKPAGYPCVAISEFYLYDRNGNRVELSASNFRSNATLNDASEGSVDALFDGTVSGDINTFKWYWHSEWRTNVGDYHYMEINVAELEADLSEFSFGYVTRREQGSPSEILVTTGSSTEDVARQYSSYILFNQYNLSTQAFRIKNSNITSEDLYMTIETVNSTNQDAGGVKILAKSKNDESQLFKFEQQSDGTFYIKSESGYYLNTLSNWGFNAVSEPQNDNRSNFTINYIGNDEFRIIGTKGLIGPNNAYATDKPYVLFSNHGTGQQYIDWILEPYSTEYTVTYNYKVGDDVMLTEEHIIAGNNDYPAVKSFYGVTIAESTPTGQVTEDGTFNFTCTVDDTKFPFAYAPDVEHITTWQYIQMHSNNKKFLKYESESNYISWSDANLLGKRDAYAWTFVGNPFVGFKMLNKAATTGKALKSTNSGNPAMVDYAEATSFLAAASSETTGTGYFCMRYPGGNYLNAQNGKVAHWSSNDAGSTMVVNGNFAEITLDEYRTDLQTLINNAETFVSANQANKSRVGYYKLTDIQAQIDNAENYTESGSMVEVDNAFLSLQNAMKNPEVNLPVAGKFYRIENNNATGYLKSGTGTGRTQFEANIGEQASSIFCYTGGKLLSYTTGLYLANQDNKLGYTNIVGEAAGTTIGFAKSPDLGKLLISFNNGNRSFYSNSAGDSDGATAGQTGAGYRFTVTEVEWLPVNVAAGYATLYSPVALSTYRYGSVVEHRVEAYTGVINGEKLSLSRIDAEDGIIPANTPVVLKSVKDVEDGNVFLKVSDSEKAAIESDLRGTFADAYIRKASYVLSAQGNPAVVGFYKAAMNQQEGAAFLNNGFKAYLPASGAGARFLTFDFGDNAETGINAVEIEEAAPANAAIYDLSGRRVQNAKSGLYIINGKKVIK